MSGMFRDDQMPPMGGGGMDPGLGGPVGPPPGVGGPPPSIDLPTSQDGRGAPHGPARGDHSDALNDAIAAISAYISDETDEADIALAHEIVAKISKLRSSQQDLVDKATGAGPGARLMRKTQGSGGGGY